MAKEKAQKEPGRIKQMVQVYKTTKEHDPKVTLIMLAAFLLPIALSIGLAALLGGGIVGWIIWPLTGVLFGLLLAMIVLGRRAERAVYTQIEGRVGAVGAVLRGLRGTWRAAEQPVAIAPKGQSAVYRVVGRGGIVLVGEGHPDRLHTLLSKEEAKIKRVLPNVPLRRILVGRDTAEQVPLPRLHKTIYKTKKALRRPEVQAVWQRLNSMQQAPIGIPKGVDPMRVRRPGKPR
ncbi:MAG: DUF4191 domain-containing protein [Microbacteriaceae bacterium]|nr:DUF4191 domain-containing protein [Microbacteriaceae bacterium]